MQTLARATSTLVLLLAAPVAGAEVEDAGTHGSSTVKRTLPGEDWSGSIGFGTNFPLDVGARFLARSPGGVRANFSMGYLPRTYVRTINSVVVRAGGYDQTTAELVQAALQSSMVLRSHFGWSPFRDWGPYAEVGYGFISLGGSATTGEVLAQIIHRPLPQSAAAAVPETFTVDAVLHQVDVEVGWDFPVSKRLELRAGIGAALTVAAQSNIEPQYESLPNFPVEPFTDFGEAYLEQVFTTYAHVPVASLGLGYRF